jgi:glycosyltransferase involved in cell wall biosynthesis
MATTQVSIVMPVYNGGGYLHESIGSILAQTFDDWEFIIINDGSTDNSEEIVSAYQKTDSRIKVIKHSGNQGLVASLNDGLRLASGTFIARQDADDWSSKDRIEKMVSWLEDNPDIGLLGSNGYYVGPDGTITRASEFPSDHGEICSEILNRETPFFHGSWMFRRECLEKVGLYNGVLFSGEDKDYWLRVSEQYQTSNYPENLYFYRNHKMAFTRQTIYRRRLMRELVIALSEERKSKGVDSLGLSLKGGLNQDRIPNTIRKSVRFLTKSARFMESSQFGGAALYLFIGFLTGLNYYVCRTSSLFLFNKQWTILRNKFGSKRP